MSAPTTDQRLEITHAPAGQAASLADDVRDGLTRPFKELSPKHLYDARGSELFDAITDLAEYYPTRTERSILQRQARTIIATTGARELVELGAGSASKTRVLLDAMRDAGQLERYVPFDIDESVVLPTAEAILGEYPELSAVHGIVGDFATDLGLIPPAQSGRPRIVALLGSTIGNFVGSERAGLLGDMAALLRPQDHLLLGADLVKDVAVLEAAYDDAEGVTAAFDLNLLTVINRELSGDLPLDAFRHVARFDRAHEWIEMRLVAEREVDAHLGAIDLDVHFDAGEEMRTEISAKFTPERLGTDLAGAGLELVTLFTDPAHLFSLALARPKISEELS